MNMIEYDRIRCPSSRPSRRSRRTDARYAPRPKSYPSMLGSTIVTSTSSVGKVSLTNSSKPRAWGALSSHMRTLSNERPARRINPSELAALVRERVVTGRVEHGLVHVHPELREDRHHPRRQLRAPSGHHDPPNVRLASQPFEVAHGGTGLPRQRRLEGFRPAPPAPVRPRVAGLALVLRPAGVRDRRVDQRAVEIPDVQLPRLLSAHRRADRCRCRSEPRVDSRVREDLR